MSHRILRALMQLFAIIASADRLTTEGRSIVEDFLKQQLSRGYVQTYLAIFDEYLSILQGKAVEGKAKKRVSVNSVKVLRICTEINGELNQKQKYVVLAKLIEFAYSSSEEVTGLELEFLSTVADVFNINNDEFESCLALTAHNAVETNKDKPQFLVINNIPNQACQHARHLFNESITGELWFYNIKSAGLLFVRYFGNSQLSINGKALLVDTVNVFSQGAVIRSAKSQPVYYSDVMRCYLEDAAKTDFSLSANHVEYVFKNGKKGLNAINFTAASGNLIGIMGGSGAGKSTLLNILNSNLKPSQGEVLINGINIHSDWEKLEGVIGFVPQDDLLMEDLTVFQNLFYNSKLCFGNLDDVAIIEKVKTMMDALGLFEIQNLKVGDPLNKSISGGQRKRLNIALELIRAPSILFVDEPTSGLSSMDSENVMDLLKQLAISGKLVFVVIHQPSSDIFKLFDKLLILDLGGYPIYFGNPVDSLIYFKNRANFADAEESECESCGYINPEQIFSIIESKVLDEFGNPTPTRKFLPEDWNSLYKEHDAKTKKTKTPAHGTLHSDFKKPTRWQQIKVFVKRDLLSKLYNTQYLLINYLEAPVLAVILAYFLRFSKNGYDYVFYDNPNLPAYIFMGAIVALFMGLTVSAEEIIRDRIILIREAFLNLSRSSYLLSKIAVMFFISAIQTFSFVLIGNLIFGIKELFLDYWLILFSVSCFANLLGLNISASFNSVVTIYILIPFLIIPQIILSGVMVKFDNLNPTITTQTQVPVIGEVMASRWAFEALAVNQFKNNSYEKIFFDTEQLMSTATFKENLWFLKMNDKLDSLYYKKYKNNSEKQLQLLENEIKKEAALINLVLKNEYNTTLVNDTFYKKTKAALESIKKHYHIIYEQAAQHKDDLVKKTGTQKLTTLENKYANKTLNNLILDKDNFDPIIEHDGGFVQRYQPIYIDGPKNSFIRSQLYVKRKNIFGQYFDTYFVNLIVLWLMTALLAVALYFNVFRKLLGKASRLFESKKMAN